MSNQPVLNPWQAAMAPPPPAPSRWFGQISVNAWTCALVKGQGKVPYTAGQVDPNTGKEVQPRTCVDLSLAPITDQAMEPITRSAIAEFGEWPDIILPSLKEIGIVDLQTLNGKWVALETVPTGRKYTNSNGEQKDATTFKFVALYADEAACKAAKAAFRAGDNPAAPAPVVTPGNGNGDDKKRATALKFLHALIAKEFAAQGGDLEKILSALVLKIADTTLVKDYFNADSPEVMDYLTTLATEKAPF